MRIINQRHALVPVDAVQPHPQNPRQGDVGAIHESINANGFFGTVIVQESTGYILAGNHRWQAVVQQGAAEIPVTFVDVDDATALRILLVDNRANDVASYDNAALAELLQSIMQSTGTLDGTGYDGDALDQLMRDLDSSWDSDIAEKAKKDEAPPQAGEVTIRVVVAQECEADVRSALRGVLQQWPDARVL